MRHLQNLLVVIGGTVAGLVLSAGIAFLVGLVVFPAGRDAGGAVVAFMILATCGGVVGALIGLAGSISWISRRSGEPFTLMTWIGMVVGLAAGLAIRSSAVLDRTILGELIEWLPGKLAFLATMAFVGGFIGTIVASWGKRQVRDASESIDQ